jgi:hypothetical protein
MIRRILLDLDDTLNSLTLHILGSVFGIGVGHHDYHKFPVECGYDIVGAYHKLKHREKHPGMYPEYDIPKFWRQVPRLTWAKTPKSPQFDFLLDRSEALVGRENVFILTSPTKDPECLAGKLEWIHDVLPDWLHRQYLIGPRKYLCARPDTLLIDDSDEQVNSFRAEGGQALLVPRPWNTHFAISDTSAYLRAKFADLERIAA